MFEIYPKINTEHVSGAVSGDIPLSYKGNTVKKNVVEDVEDDVDELPGSYFAKAFTRVFDETYNGKAGVRP